MIMETVLNKRKIRAQRTTDDISLSKRSHLKATNNVLSIDDIEYWQAMAKRLDNSVLANNITMQEIVDEVNAVRKERYEKQNCI